MSLGVDPLAPGLRDRDLLAAARNGSPEALGELLQSFRTYLLVIGEQELSDILRARVNPSDLVQETFVEGQRSIANFQGESTQEFAAWLRGILLNRLAHARRFHLGAERRSLLREEAHPERSSLVERPDVKIDEETPSRVAARAEEAAVIRAALSRLPEHYRQVIQLRNFELLSFAEIGLILDRPHTAARALWTRAMRQLKKELHGKPGR